jgi:hypothetical protein
MQQVAECHDERGSAASGTRVPSATKKRGIKKRRLIGAR